MQGIQIAPAKAAAAGAATSAMLPGGGDDGDVAGNTGGGGFGSILAEQIKGRTLVMKDGVETGLLEKTDVKKISMDSLAAEGAITSSALSDFLALANAGAIPIQITPVALAPAAQAGADAVQDQLTLAVGGDVAAMAAMAGKPVAMNDVAAITETPTGVNDVAAEPASFAGLLAGKTLDSASMPVMEGFAGSGKMLPKTEPASKPAQDAGKPVETPGELAGNTLKPAMEPPVSGNKPPVAEPVAMKLTPEEFKPGKPMPDTAKLNASGESANNPATPLAMPQTPAMPGNPSAPAHASAAEIAAPVGSPGWSNALADKVTWMSGQGSQVAELRLNPPHLGPLEVQLTVANDQASAVFVSHHPAVREAIEAAMPRLREMLADSGIMLGNTMVGAESFQQQQQQAFAKNSGGGGGTSETRDEGASLGVLGQTGGSAAARAGKGMVDTFV